MATATSAKFCGHKCFRVRRSGFDLFKPINVIIGRNNTGKSSLLDFVMACCKKDSAFPNGWECYFEAVLDPASLKEEFSEKNNAREGHPLGNHPWESYGSKYVGANACWKIASGATISIDDISVKEFQEAGDPVSEIIQKKLSRALSKIKPEIHGSEFRRLAADRDIRLEPASDTIRLESNGDGATNLVRDCLNSVGSFKLKSIVERDFLSAINEIFSRDGVFDRITVQEHSVPNNEESSMGNGRDKLWEIYFEQRGNGLVPLSGSGSGLKTIVLVLLNLIVYPQCVTLVESGKRFTYAFEELENNMHPAMFRRLLSYIENHVNKTGHWVFLTTHSSVAIDYFGGSSEAQFIRVSHDGNTASTETISCYSGQISLVRDLGARPSDLLQANGVIWVEGPSDRIYLNRWIEIFSNGQLREGRHYQCAFYGGSLLGCTTFDSSCADSTDKMTNLFAVNHNVAVVCDSDRASKKELGSELKPRVKSIKADVDKIKDAFIWITETKEIENYLPGSVFASAFNITGVPNPSQFDTFFRSRAANGRPKSFIEKHIEPHAKIKSCQKVDMALKLAPAITRDSMYNRFDFESKINELIGRIREWNS